MIIRILQAVDAARFKALRLRALQECPTAFAASYDEEAAATLNAVGERLTPRPDSVVCGAFRDDELVGIAGVKRETPSKLAHKAYIWGVYVAPEARRHGVGAQLLTAALRHAQSEFHVRQVNLGVNARNVAATALYKRLGFVEFGLERDYLMHAGVFHDERHMVWFAPELAASTTKQPSGLAETL